MIIELSKENLKKIEKISKIDKLALDCIKHDITTILSTYQFEFNTPKTRDSMNAQISDYLDNHIINIREERNLGL